MSVIVTEKLSCQFRSIQAVDALNLELEEGSIFALLGPNGAGKSTTIKILMGILGPSSGQSRVFGVDSRKLTRSEWQRVGYVSEDQSLPGGLTVSGLMAYCAPMYPTWDSDFCENLLKHFELPRDRKLRALSRGMRMKAALISSIAYRPELLVLDEPFSGLDPVVREEFIEGILELTGQEHWTVLLSSHDMEEVERLADRIGIIVDGRMVLDDRVEKLQQRCRRVEVTLAKETGKPLKVPDSWARLKLSGKRAEFVHANYEARQLESEVSEVFSGAVSSEVFAMNLREIYIAVTRGERQSKSVFSNKGKKI